MGGTWNPGNGPKSRAGGGGSGQSTTGSGGHVGDLELLVLSVGAVSAEGRGRARGPGREGGVSRWKGVLWGNIPGWNAEEKIGG